MLHEHCKDGVFVGQREREREREGGRERKRDVGGEREGGAYKITTPANRHIRPPENRPRTKKKAHQTTGWPYVHICPEKSKKERYTAKLRHRHTPPIPAHNPNSTPAPAPAAHPTHTHTHTERPVPRALYS